ncbi:formate hydrogenlyase complex iron-sulfur subunit [Vibrio gazogenes]|uniref:Hydrogenase-4 component H n=1 Tax=Vibrio gazogenes DSM 21264 = NBRC 103151 TaxID=1123492 RepID=A0A1M4ZWV4_VIBGA|nr:formate hydrogenlyase complex iron-sulfur subunit [Vibrio gazogenes]USP13437.1 4Fe-4S dicluster domain-containing protein [Vibrio gazogenes]SHF22317.1 hydrogenase-4 component H [Vibrio gazogenes DSM 21264] [Vibrio gazogenes DSM 21264 = NBRC 103151]SJN57236.1 NAD(P)H-quinone oxidoreductase subunit I [Vibrio gazogenes]
MLKLLKTVLKTGDATAKYPFAPYEVSSDFRGKPELDPAQCIACGACMRACPANALVMETDEQKGTRRWELSLARCIYCGRCEEVCPTHALVLSQQFELAVTNKADLYEQAEFELVNCRECDRPFIAKKLFDYVMETLQHAGLSGESLEMRRHQLESCPECRRQANMLDGQNLACHRYVTAEPIPVKHIAATHQPDPSPSENRCSANHMPNINPTDIHREEVQ